MGFSWRQRQMEGERLTKRNLSTIFTKTLFCIRWNRNGNNRCDAMQASGLQVREKTSNHDVFPLYFINQRRKKQKIIDAWNKESSGRSFFLPLHFYVFLKWSWHSSQRPVCVFGRKKKKQLSAKSSRQNRCTKNDEKKICKKTTKRKKKKERKRGHLNVIDTSIILKKKETI